MLNKKSNELILFFIKNKCLHGNKEKLNMITKKCFLYLFQEMFNSEKYVNSLTISPKVEKIIKRNIPNPGNLQHVPHHIKQHIHNKSLFYLRYQFSLLDRKIIIHFVTESDGNVELYNNYVKRMLMWLYILNNQSQNKTCSKVLNIYVYFSTITKELPKIRDYILDESNVNTAYTYACKEDNIIVIYRKEEWFKVFIHETFHSFGMDFASMDSFPSRECILGIFNVESEVNLFEAYSEFWARIMNSLFVSYVHCNKTTNDFLTKCEFFIYLEKIYSFFQMIKVLRYMKITYTDFFSTISSVKLKYREKSNVLSYYVLTNILMYYYQHFISWCITNNGSKQFMYFKKEVELQNKMCLFIREYYKTKQFLNSIVCMENSILKLTNLHYNIKNNLRMTICELE
jgi:hypothetical protein